MLNKDSIETAIILAKLLRKENASLGGAGRGTLVRALFDESLALCKDIEVNAEDIENGEYGELIDAIYKAHVTPNTFINDVGEIEEEPIVHDGWMTNYKYAISKAIFNNVDLIKKVVIPDVGSLHAELVELHNSLLPNLQSELLSIRPVIIPDLYMSGEYEDLVYSHLSENNKPEEVVDFPYGVMLEEDFKIDFSNSGSIDFSEFIKAPGVAKVIRDYIGHDSKQTYLSKRNLNELGILIAFFFSVYEKPYINTGVSSVVNKKWAHYNLHLVLTKAQELLTLILNEKKRGLIFSSLTPNLTRVYPRISVDGTLPEVYYHQENLSEVKSDMQDKEFIIGMIVSKFELGQFSFSDITEDHKRTIQEGYNDFIKFVNRNSFKTVNTSFAESVNDLLGRFNNKRRTPFFDSNSVVVQALDVSDYIPKNSPITDDDLFELAKRYVCEMMYAGTNAKDLFDVFYKSAEEGKSLEVILLSVSNDLIVDFLMEQVELLRSY